MNEDMIIANMSNAEKITFLKCFVFMVSIDGKIDEEERDFVSEMGKIYGINFENINVSEFSIKKENLLEDIKLNVKERKNALLLIKDLLMLANIDEHLHDKEIDFIKDVAEKLEIEDKKVLQINALIMDRKIWLFSYKKVMEQTD